MRRGDLVTIAGAGADGSRAARPAPRPAVVIQSDLFDEHPSVIVLPLTFELRETPLFRIQVEPDAGNGLPSRAQVMVDKPRTVARDRLAATGGSLDEITLLAVTRAMAVFLGFA